MYLAYTDESGDAGFHNSPTRFFVLTCLLVHESAWQATLNQLIDMRRMLKADYGVPMRQEVKAIDIVYGRRALHGIAKATRLSVYRSLLDRVRLQFETLSFAVAIDKSRITLQSTNDPGR